MRKTLYTLNVNDYAPEILRYTGPLLSRYAEKIGAELHVIRDRRWPDTAPVYEKLQIHDLARERDDDWSIYIDSDALVHPDFFDVTEHLTMDTVCHNGMDMAGNRWKYDDYFRRDGRHIGSCNWFTIGSRWCRDLWRPLDDLSYAEAIARITPIQGETQSVITPDHLIDDYVLSRNIARFGLKCTTVLQILKRLDDTNSDYLNHAYTLTVPNKLVFLRRVLSRWELSDYVHPNIPGWMGMNELTWLYLTAQAMGSVVEIGPWRGKATHALASGCAGPVTSIDHFQGSATEQDLSHVAAKSTDIESELRRNVGHLPNLTIVRGDSREMASRFPDNSVDMVFLDGAHDYESVCQDLKAWWPKVTRLLCGHDFDRVEVRKALYDSTLMAEQEAGSIWSVNKRREFGG